MSLFHYTNAEALISLLTTQELWLTDIRFLNDSDEARDGAKYIHSAINNLKRCDDMHLDHAMESLTDFSVDNVFIGLSELQMFVASFSGLGDSLNQWRSYGLYCIEFSDEIRNIAPFEKCIYEHFEKTEYAQHLAIKARESIASNLKTNGGASNYLDTSIQIWELGDAVSLFKHHSFKDEREARLITQASPSDDDVYYRTRGELVIPFQKKTFPLSSVKAIHVGPMKHQDLAVSSIKSLISNIEKKYQGKKYEGVDQIQVFGSKIPYRAF